MNATYAHKVEAAEVFRVTSGRTGKVYYVDARPGPVTRCTCPAGVKGIRCSHFAAVEAFATKVLGGK